MSKEATLMVTTPEGKHTTVGLHKGFIALYRHRVKIIFPGSNQPSAIEVLDIGIREEGADSSEQSQDNQRILVKLDVKPDDLTFEFNESVIADLSVMHDRKDRKDTIVVAFRYKGSGTILKVNVRE